MSVKINTLEIENVKRVKAVRVKPEANGLTVIGGNNAQGKTSILDAIAWALGGNSYRPSKPTREGSLVPPNLKVTLSNGLVVERKGKNSDLKVIDPQGNKAGQNLLNSFIEELALNIPKFMESSNKEKANILLRIIGVGDQLAQLEKKEQEIYNQRHTIGQIKDQKVKFAREQQFFADAPKDLVSASDLIKQQQDILYQNGENDRKRNNLANLEETEKHLQKQLAEISRQLEQVNKDLEIARMDAIDLHDQSTAELENNIQQIEEINRKVRINLDKEKAEDDAKQYEEQYNQLSIEITKTRDDKAKLLESASLPLPGLSVDAGELIYNNQKWDNMSSSEQLKVATAIVRKLNPNCGFVLIDKLEQMDLDTMKEFGSWLEVEGLQAIATRVSSGDECSIIIEDGYVKGEAMTLPEVPTNPNPTGWTGGEF